VMSFTTHANLPLVVVHRMEEKLGNMESENQVLRQQTLVLSPTKGLSNRFKSTVFQVSLLYFLHSLFLCNCSF
jgi:hypothetical protein